uniref:Uncharacterized protein n=1 Tax=mine drainage metagenome TaxID=410659 RepID=E6QE12_9ZZZZ
MVEPLSWHRSYGSANPRTQGNQHKTEFRKYLAGKFRRVRPVDVRTSYIHQLLVGWWGWCDLENQSVKTLIQQAISRKLMKLR